jgi:hypothetical protein
MGQRFILGLRRRRHWAAVVAAAAALALARPAHAQRPVIFQGHSPVVTQAKATVNGQPVSTALLVAEIQALNNPSYLVLLPNGAAGYIPSAASALGLPPSTTLYGTYRSLPNGYIQVGGSTTFQANGVAVAAYVNGVVFAYQGQFYAVMNLVGVVKAPSGQGTEVDVDTATFVMPLKVIAS